MSIGNTRKGFTQAQFNDSASSLLMGEIVVISALLGWANSSWYVFGGLFIGLIILFFIPVINIILTIIFSVAWAFIGAAICCYFEDVSLSDTSSLDDLFLTLFSVPSSQVVGAILLLISLGIHFAGIEWIRDVSDPEDRNI